MKKYLFLSILIILSVSFHAEKHVVISTYDGGQVSSPVSSTDYILIENDSLSLAGMDGTITVHESLSKIRSLSVKDLEPTSVRPDEHSFGPADSTFVNSKDAVIRLEDGQLFIYRNNQKYTITGVQVQ